MQLFGSITCKIILYPSQIKSFYLTLKLDLLEETNFSVTLVKKKLLLLEAAKPKNNRGRDIPFLNNIYYISWQK